MWKLITSRHYEQPLSTDNLSARLSNAERLIAPVKTNLLQAEYEIAARSHGLGRLQGKYNKLSASSQQHAAKSNNSLAVAKLTQLGKLIDQEKTSLKKANLALAKMQGLSPAVEDRMTELRTRVENNRKTAEQVRTERVKLQQNINKLQNELNESKHGTNKTKTTARIDSLTNRIAKHDATIQLAQTELVTLKQVINSLQLQQNQIQNACELITTNLEEAQASQHQTNTLEVAKRASLAKIDEFTKAIATSESERELLKQELGETTAKDTTKKIIATLTGTDTPGKLDTGHSELSMADARQSDLEQSIEKLTKNLTSKIAAANATAGQMTELNADFAIAEEQLQRLDTNTTALHQELKISSKKHFAGIVKLNKASTALEAESVNRVEVYKKFQDLQVRHKALKLDHKNSLNQAHRKIAELSNALTVHENAAKVAHAPDTGRKVPVGSRQNPASSINETVGITDKPITKANTDKTHR